MKSTIPLTARAPRAFTPPTLEAKHQAALEEYTGPKKGAPAKPVFFIAVPTLLERETIGQLMFELGAMPVTRDTIRNATLEALIARDDDGEEDAAWLEGHWQQTEIYEDQLEIWQQQENQRLIDEWHDPSKKREAFPMPEALTSLKDRIRAKNLVDEVVARDARVRRLLAAQTRYGKQYEIMGMRVHLRGWEGLETTRSAVGGDGLPDLVTEECAEALREEIGTDAWRELWQSIDSMYGLSKEEVGNSGSPLENGSTGGGSKSAGPETDTGISSGTPTETKSSSPPSPGSASDQTTEQSSGSGGDGEA